LERGRFLHASTSQGVTISELDEAYWKTHYWKARRIET
jgi:probable lipoprotein NlpC